MKIDDWHIFIRKAVVRERSTENSQTLAQATASGERRIFLEES
jgi:hypothetical protein